LSVITKVLVVLVMVLSVAAVALLVPYVANSEDYKDQIAKLEATRKTAAITESALTDQVRQALERNDHLAADQGAALKAKDEVADGLRHQVDSLRQDNQKLAVENEQYKGDAARWLTSQDASRKILESTLAELDRSRKVNESLSVKAASLSEAEAQQRNDKAAMQRQFDQAQQELVRVNDSLSEMQGWWQQVPAAERDRIAHGVHGPVVATTPLYGAVDRVSAAGGGKQLIQIDIGKNDGVAENMVFRIYRNTDHTPKFLGRLVIVRVDDRQAAGVVELGQAEITKGDKVESGGL
jgi:hypothetical protein